MTKSESLPIPKPEIKPGMKLHEVIDALVKEEAAAFSLTEAEHKLLGEMLVSETDRLCYARDQIEDEIERQKKYAKEHANLAKTLQNGLDRLESYISNFMVHGSFEKLSGEKRQISLRKSQETIVPDREPTIDDYLSHKNFVRRTVKYSWNKEAIKEALERGEVPIPSSSIRVNLNPQFGPKKRGSK